MMFKIKSKELELIEVYNVSCPKIEVVSIKEFFKLIVTKYKPDLLFWQKPEASNTSNKEQFVYFIDKGIAYGVHTNHFNTITEMIKGWELGYENGKEFQKGIDLGAKDGAEYSAFMESGLSDINLFRDSERKGLYKIFKIWKENFDQLSSNQDLPCGLQYTAFIEADVISTGGFDLNNLSTIQKAYKAGFWKKIDFEESSRLGFKTAADYLQAKNFQIVDPVELSELKNHGIKKSEQWKLYKEKKTLANKEGFPDVFSHLLYKHIEKYLPGQIIQIGVLQQVTQQALINPCGITIGPYFDFSKQKNNNSIEKVIELPQFKELLIKQENGNFKRRNFKTKERKCAVLDINNILLYRSEEYQGINGSFVLVENLITKLRNLGIKRIVGFSDANIRHIVTDTEFEQMKSILDLFKIADSGIPADIYILDYARQNPSIIVSNDQYNDYKDGRHSWNMENLPRVLLTFTFDENDMPAFPEKEAELSN